MPLRKKEFLNAGKGDGVIDLGEILEKRSLPIQIQQGWPIRLKILKSGRLWRTGTGLQKIFLFV